MQRTFISSLMIAIFCFGNVILSAILVIRFDLEIFGVAAGTAIAAYVTVILFLIFSYLNLNKKLKISPTYKTIFNVKKMLKLFSY